MTPRKKNSDRSTLPTFWVDELLAPPSAMRKPTPSDNREADFLKAALAALPDTQRVVAVMAFVGGLSNSEIAERLEIPTAIVRTRLRKAYRSLMATLASTEPHAQEDPLIQSVAEVSPPKTEAQTSDFDELTDEEWSEVRHLALIILLSDGLTTPEAHLQFVRQSLSRIKGVEHVQS